jgi:predicted RNase H-like nuclease
VLGVDASRAGWVGIELVDGRFVGAHLAVSLADLVGVAGGAGAGRDAAAGRGAVAGGAAGGRSAASVGGFDAAGVDTPIGLLDAGWRDCDRLAAERIGRRRSSVFRVPPRAAWEPDDYPSANARCRALTGAGFSRQAFNLRPRILEANALYEAGVGEGRPPPLYEVHPEVSFHALAGAELPYAKHSWAGHALRRSLLSAAGIDLPDDLGEAGRAGPDDVLDAAAVAWTADRIVRGIAGSLPEPPQHGHIAIWY